MKLVKLSQRKAVLCEEVVINKKGITAYAPRLLLTPDRSKYVPHQGQRECKRRQGTRVKEPSNGK